MKKYLFLALLFSVMGFSQNGISYQALILNPSGEQLPGQDNSNAPISNKLVCLKFAIVDHTNQIEYLETHKITTDAYGIVNLVIGTGEQIGGYASSFSNVVWGDNPKSLKVDLDVNANCTYFVEISNQPFTYVPFAYYAANSGNANVQDATTTVNGIIRLGGDLGGVGTTANAPIISNNAIVSAKISNGAVTPIKIAPGSNNTVLVTNNTGNVSWLDSATFSANYGLVGPQGPAGATGPAGTNGSDASVSGLDPINVTSGVVSLNDAGVTTDKLADASVTTSKIASGGNNKVLVTDGTGNVVWSDFLVEVDGIIGNEVTDAVADGGLVRSGTGTTADPYKLKINDGTTNGQILTWNGTKWVAQAAPAEVDGIIGNEVTDAVADGGLVRSGTGTTADPYKLKINDGTTNGQILTWDGTKWVATAASNDWKLTGNAGTTAGTNFVGTTDAVDFVTKTNNAEVMRATSTGNVGVGTASPTSKLQVNGSFALPLLNTASDITLDATHATVRLDATTANVNVTLPAANTATNRIYTVIKADSTTNKLIFSATILGNGFTFTEANVPGEYKLQSNGTNWYLLD